jgi:hypothetical protein
MRGTVARDLRKKASYDNKEAQGYILVPQRKGFRYFPEKLSKLQKFLKKKPKLVKKTIVFNSIQVDPKSPKRLYKELKKMFYIAKRTGLLAKWRKDAE